jgi:hypothetical protein
VIPNPSDAQREDFDETRWHRFADKWLLKISLVCSSNAAARRLLQVNARNSFRSGSRHDFQQSDRESCKFAPRC